MTAVLYFFVAAGILISVLANIVIWSGHRLSMKLTALVLAALFLPLGYASLANLLSRPKPIAFEWDQGVTDEATVLGARIDEGEQIYVWLQIAGTDEPRAYTLPWDKQIAQQLHAARRQAEEQGGELRMRRPRQPEQEPRDPMFYAPAQDRLPPKTVPGTNGDA